jgi:hypothetical protein
MVIDLTAQFAPLFWLLVAALLVLAGAILASVDPDRTEVVLGDRNLLIATAMLGMLVVGALATFSAPVIARWP